MNYPYGNVVVGGRFYDGEWRDMKTGEKMTFYGPGVHSPNGGPDSPDYLSFGNWRSPTSPDRLWAKVPYHEIAIVLCQKSLIQGQ